MAGLDKEAKKHKEVPAGRSLIDLVFSWSIDDVRNNDLYKNQVKRIPETFSSTSDYMSSLIPPLLEETHADMSSSLKNMANAPVREVLAIGKSKEYRAPRDLFYSIQLKPRGAINGPRAYEPEVGDLLALSDVRPESVSDLNRPGRPYLVAYIRGFENGNPDMLKILASKPIPVHQKKKNHKDTGKRTTDSLFIVFLTNLITNIRIWRSLKSELDGCSPKMITRVLQGHPNGGKDCSYCSSASNRLAANDQLKSIKDSSGLNLSQKEAIISCICMTQCRHQNSVKLIWGPPGTGKTKTISLLLFSLLKLNCRTLTCAPTNIAVLAVTSRLLGLFKESMESGNYGLGDIVLFGNEDRMKIAENDHLCEVFLDNRVHVLCMCLNPSTGWKHNVESITSLLDDPEREYRQCHISEEKEEKKKEINECHENEEQEDVDDEDITAKKRPNNWKKHIHQALKENKGKKGKQKKVSASGKEVETIEKEGKKASELLTFEMFLKQKIRILSDRLEFCIVNLSTHLPTSIISLEEVKDMNRALDLLKSLRTFTHSASNKHLKQVFSGVKSQRNTNGNVSLVRTIRRDCLQILRSLPRVFKVPNKNEYAVRNFCLQEARLIFCTASSSVKLHAEKMKPLELLVIDEAAQLKECESTISLQLPGLRHAILIGDEHQLPAMVQSKISEGAKFGRSLFERLTSLGHKKHLLNMQYRMHPSISLFPNKEFYAMKIQDAPTVKRINYQKKFLQGNLYGPYSFINIPRGKEQFKDGYSCRNKVEVAVVSDILARLYKEFTTTRKTISIGVISPYKAQVHAIEEKIGKLYGGEKNFSVKVRSVDGFQGSEEDVIIMSTVRCNGKGSIGFLANLQRANVSLTRARYCLWILGNKETLIKSDSVWKKLVIDAMQRACFFNADEDKSLAKAIMDAMAVKTKDLLNINPLQVGKSVWKVCFSADFRKSIVGISSSDVQKEVVTLLGKLSTGWRRPVRSIIMLKTTCSELLEYYRVIDCLYLIWSVDIIEENSNYIQVLKVWDALPRHEIPELSKRLDSMFQKYTMGFINLCKHKLVKGDLALPMRWSIDSGDIQENIHSEVDGLQQILQRFDSLGIRDQSEESTTTSMYPYNRSSHRESTMLLKQKLCMMKPF